MVTDAGTVAFAGSELFNEIDAAALGADVNDTASDPVPFEEIVIVEGDNVLSTGFAGVVPSVVNWMTGFNSTLLLKNDVEIR